MKHAMLNRIIRNTIYIVLPGAAISLLICTVVLGNNLFIQLLPVYVFLAFAAAYFVIGYIPRISRIKWLRPAIIGILALTSAILLIIFVK